MVLAPMADFKKLQLDTSAATTVAGFGPSNNGAQGARRSSLRDLDLSSKGKGAAAAATAASAGLSREQQYDSMQLRDGNGSVTASPLNNYGLTSMSNSYFDKRDNLLAHPTSYLLEHRSPLGEGGSQSSSPGLENTMKKFAAPSMTQHVANASATALRSRHGSDADRLVYNPITGIPFRSNSPDRTNPIVQTRLARSPFQALSDQVGDAGNGDSAAPRSTPVRTALSKTEYQALSSSDDDDEFAIQIMSRSDPGFARSDSIERSMSFQLRRRPSGQRSSRRGSARSFSGPSPLSPAANFLAGFNRETAPTSAPSPDSEGQEIGDQIHGRYIIGRELGRGGFSNIKEVQTMSNGEKILRAVKILLKQPKGVPEEDMPKTQLQFEHERVIWSYLPKDEPTLLPLIAVFDTDFATFCITKKLPGGSLQDLIRRNRRASTTSITSTASGASNFGGARSIPFNFARRYIFQLATALRLLHEDLAIVHRDVKLENCLLENHAAEYFEDSGSLMLCDFGMADFISPEDRERYCPQGFHNGSDRSSPNSSPRPQSKLVGPATSSVSLGPHANAGVPGSLPYASPELLEATEPIFHPSIDMWAFGVACYAMLVGRLPFHHTVAAIQQLQIIKGEWSEETLLSALEEGVDSEQVLELIRGCLHMNPEQRWTVGQVLTCNLLEPERSASSQ